MVVVVMDDAPSSSSYPSTRSLMLDTADGFDGSVTFMICTPSPTKVVTSA